MQVVLDSRECSHLCLCEPSPLCVSVRFVQLWNTSDTSFLYVSYHKGKWQTGSESCLLRVGHTQHAGLECVCCVQTLLKNTICSASLSTQFQWQWRAALKAGEPMCIWNTHIWHVKYCPATDLQTCWCVTLMKHEFWRTWLNRHCFRSRWNTWYWLKNCRCVSFFCYLPCPDKYIARISILLFFVFVSEMVHFTYATPRSRWQSNSHSIIIRKDCFVEWHVPSPCIGSDGTCIHPQCIVMCRVSFFL